MTYTVWVNSGMKGAYVHSSGFLKSLLHFRTNTVYVGYHEHFFTVIFNRGEIEN